MTHTILPFTSSVGPTIPIPESLLEILELFFTPTIVEEIVNQTNRYAEEVMRVEAYVSWKTISEEDIRAFICFCILMGINQQSSMDDYWKKDPIHSYKLIAQRISRDRFRDISRCLHFIDNTTLSQRGSAKYDKLGKILHNQSFSAEVLFCIQPELRDSY